MLRGLGEPGRRVESQEPVKTLKSGQESLERLEEPDRSEVSRKPMALLMRSLEIPDALPAQKKAETLGNVAQEVLKLPRTLHELQRSELAELHGKVSGLAGQVETQKKSAEYLNSKSWKESGLPFGRWFGWDAMANHLDGVDTAGLHQKLGQIREASENRHRNELNQAVKDGDTTKLQSLLSEKPSELTPDLSKEEIQWLYNQAVVVDNPEAMEVLKNRGATPPGAASEILGEAAQKGEMGASSMSVLTSLLRHGEKPSAEEVEKHAQTIIGGGNPELRQQLLALSDQGLSVHPQTRKTLSTALLHDEVRGALQSGNTKSLEAFLNRNMHVMNESHQGNNALDVALKAYRDSGGADRNAYKVAQFLMGKQAKSSTQAMPENHHRDAYIYNMQQAMDKGDMGKLRSLLDAGINGADFVPQVGTQVREGLFTHALNEGNFEALRELMTKFNVRTLELPHGSGADVARAVSRLLEDPKQLLANMDVAKALLQSNPQFNLAATDEQVRILINKSIQSGDIGTLNALKELGKAGLPFAKSAFDDAIRSTIDRSLQQANRAKGKQPLKQGGMRILEKLDGLMKQGFPVSKEAMGKSLATALEGDEPFGGHSMGTLMWLLKREPNFSPEDQARVNTAAKGIAAKAIAAGDVKTLKKLSALVTAGLPITDDATLTNLSLASGKLNTERMENLKGVLQRGVAPSGSERDTLDQATRLMLSHINLGDADARQQLGELVEHGLILNPDDLDDAIRKAPSDATDFLERLRDGRSGDNWLERQLENPGLDSPIGTPGQKLGDADFRGRGGADGQFLTGKYKGLTPLMAVLQEATGPTKAFAEHRSKGEQLSRPATDALKKSGGLKQALTLLLQRNDVDPNKASTERMPFLGGEHGEIIGKTPLMFAVEHAVQSNDLEPLQQILNMGGKKSVDAEMQHRAAPDGEWQTKKAADLVPSSKGDLPEGSLISEDNLAQLRKLLGASE